MARIQSLQQNVLFSSDSIALFFQVADTLRSPHKDLHYKDTTVPFIRVFSYYTYPTRILTMWPISPYAYWSALFAVSEFVTNWSDEESKLEWSLNQALSTDWQIFCSEHWYQSRLGGRNEELEGEQDEKWSKWLTEHQRGLYKYK